MLLETNKKHKYNQFTQIDFDGDSEDDYLIKNNKI